jgi:hypothetical protein
MGDPQGRQLKATLRFLGFQPSAFSFQALRFQLHIPGNLLRKG